MDTAGVWVGVWLLSSLMMSHLIDHVELDSMIYTLMPVDSYVIQCLCTEPSHQYDWEPNIHASTPSATDQSNFVWSLFWPFCTVLPMNSSWYCPLYHTLLVIVILFFFCKFLFSFFSVIIIFFVISRLSLERQNKFIGLFYLSVKMIDKLIALRCIELCMCKLYVHIIIVRYKTYLQCLVSLFVCWHTFWPLYWASVPNVPTLICLHIKPAYPLKIGIKLKVQI